MLDPHPDAADRQWRDGLRNWPDVELGLAATDREPVGQAQAIPAFQQDEDAVLARSGPDYWLATRACCRALAFCRPIVSGRRASRRSNQYLVSSTSARYAATITITSSQNCHGNAPNPISDPSGL